MHGRMTQMLLDRWGLLHATIPLVEQGIVKALSLLY